MSTVLEEAQSLNLYFVCGWKGKLSNSSSFQLDKGCVISKEKVKSLTKRLTVRWGYHSRQEGPRIIVGQTCLSIHKTLLTTRAVVHCKALDCEVNFNCYYTFNHDQTHGIQPEWAFTLMSWTMDTCVLAPYVLMLFSSLLTITNYCIITQNGVIGHTAH